MIISQDSTQLIADVREDISLFGSSFKVYAIYAYREINGQEFYYISAYVDAEKPTEKEADTREEYDELLKNYEDNIAILKNKKHELMTLAELLDKLIEQDSVL